jgi:hypothetical protein
VPRNSSRRGEVGVITNRTEKAARGSLEVLRIETSTAPVPPWGMVVLPIETTKAA